MTTLGCYDSPCSWCPSIEDIRHTGLRRHTVAVHDDQIAAGMCGIGSTMALDRLVEELEGITLDKNETLSDWRMRPLSSFVVV